MSDLSPKEKRVIEKLLGMEGGYVLNFSNSSFQGFIVDTVDIDIYDSKYEYGSGSKANRLRKFLEVESNTIVCELLENLLEFWQELKDKDNYDFIFRSEEEGELLKKKDEQLRSEFMKIISRLKLEKPIEHAEVFKANNNDKNFSSLSKLIREQIDNNQPEAALDRLHTFVIKYIRELCDRKGIVYDKKIPLNGLFGMYIKYITDNKLIESDMSLLILKSSIAILDKFNHVRNDKSYAHDNEILNYDESILIFNNVANVIKFLEGLEKKMKEEIKPNDYEDLLFK